MKCTFVVSHVVHSPRTHQNIENIKIFKNHKNRKILNYRKYDEQEMFITKYIPIYDIKYYDNYALSEKYHNIYILSPI